MNMLRYMWYLLVFQPAEVVAALACAVVSLSCVLLINHMPRGLNRLPEKALLAWITIGTFAGAVGPMCGIFISPTWAELMFYSGVAAWSMWLTWPFWRELPMLDRRRLPREVAATVYDDEAHRVA